MEITEEKLTKLRLRVASGMSERRFVHTAEVEKMIARLCALYCPEKTMKMRAAALLHDITKEFTPEKQVALCVTYGLEVTKTDLRSPKTFHARTAAELIKKEFPEWADEEIVSAVRFHTTGHAGMTLAEKMLYLADFIDESRTFENCVILRNEFWNANPEKMTADQRLAHLNRILILSYDMTVRELLDEQIPIAVDTVNARNELIVNQKI